MGVGFRAGIILFELSRPRTALLCRMRRGKVESMRAAAATRNSRN